MAEQDKQHLAWLLEKGRLQEEPFTSTVPLLGPLIVWFRNAWNSVAAKWVIRPIIQQQTEFNTLLVRQISSFEEQIIEQVIEQDREQIALIREMGELALQLKQMNRLLARIDQRLAHLEAGHDQPGVGEEA